MYGMEPMPPPPELRAETDDTHGQRIENEVNITRRAMLGYGLAGAALAAVGGVAKTTSELMSVDQMAADFLYRGTETSYPSLAAGPIHAGIGQHRVSDRVMVHGGIGQTGRRCRQLAELLGQGAYRDRRLHYSDPAPEGVDLGQAVEAYARLQDSAIYMDEVCVSMGLLARTSIHLRQAENYRLQNGKPLPAATPAVGAIASLTILNSPTMGLDSVYHGEAIKDLLSLWEDREAHLSDKFAVKALDKLINRHERDLKGALCGAARELFDALPPKMWLSQMRQIRDVHLLSLAQSGQLQGFIGPWTRVLYVRSDNDRVVKNNESCEAAEEMAALSEASFSVVTMYDAGHANVARLAQDWAYKKWVGARTLSA